MRRREFMAGIGAVALMPLAVRAQQRGSPVIGYLSVGYRDLQHPFLVAFRDGLKQGGYIDGQNVTLEYRWAEERPERLAQFARELVERNADVIVAAGDLPLRAAARATSTLPIVFITGADPVQSGLIGSLAQPGGNLTGITAIATDLLPKRVELLRELVIEPRTIALLVKSGSGAEARVRFAQAATGYSGVQLLVLEASDDGSLEAAFDSMRQQQATALIVTADAFFFLRRAKVAELALHYKIPAIYELKEYVSSGGLISYGPDLPSLRRDLGIYAAKILRGAKPADLPVQQPTRLELVINLRTAKALGVTIPTSLLLQANDLIE